MNTPESLGLDQEEMRLLLEFFQSSAKRTAMSKLLERRLSFKLDTLKSSVTRDLSHEAALAAGAIREIEELASVFTDLSS